MNIGLDTELLNKIDKFFDTIDSEQIRSIHALKLNGLRRYDTILSDRNNRYHDSFRAQINEYTRKLFDPYARDTRSYPMFIYTFSDGSQIDTTLGQLNFFMWMLKNKVMDCI